jgi:hypothetical protein
VIATTERHILLELLVTDIEAWFAALDHFADLPFMEEGPTLPRLNASRVAIRACLCRSATVITRDMSMLLRRPPKTSSPIACSSLPMRIA